MRFICKKPKRYFRITLKIITFAPRKCRKLQSFISNLSFQTMTKAEIIDRIVENTGVQRREVSSTVEAFMDVIKDALLDRENVYLRGFGSFIIKHRAEKTARNISKNITITIPAHDLPSFKPAKTFLEKMKEEQQ